MWNFRSVYSLLVSDINQDTASTQNLFECECVCVCVFVWVGVAATPIVQHFQFFVVLFCLDFLFPSLNERVEFSCHFYIFFLLVAICRFHRVLFAFNFCSFCCHRCCCCCCGINITFVSVLWRTRRTFQDLDAGHNRVCIIGWCLLLPAFFTCIKKYWKKKKSVERSKEKGEAVGATRLSLASGCKQFKGTEWHKYFVCLPPLFLSPSLSLSLCLCLPRCLHWPCRTFSCCFLSLFLCVVCLLLSSFCCFPFWRLCVFCCLTGISIKCCKLSFFPIFPPPHLNSFLDLPLWPTNWQQPFDYTLFALLSKTCVCVCVVPNGNYTRMCSRMSCPRSHPTFRLPPPSPHGVRQTAKTG